jgi:uncharacterized repeat protein (TIGR01451 family)
VTWDNPSSGPTPTTFNIYRRLSNQSLALDPNGTGIPYTSTTSDPTYTYTDSHVLSIGVSNYYAVAAVYNGIPGTKVPTSPQSIAPSACNQGNLSRSDKDISKVESRTGINKTFTTNPCSGATNPVALPSNALFSNGDIISFQLNVCNSGNTIMNNITVRDTLEKMSNPGNFTSNPPGCMSGTPVVNGNTIDFTLAPIPAAPSDVEGGVSLCSLRFTAVITAPSGSAGIYRFQNVGLISDGLTRDLRVFTPYFPFTLTGGVPDRNETAPPRTGL